MNKHHPSDARIMPAALSLDCCSNGLFDPRVVAEPVSADGTYSAKRAVSAQMRNRSGS
jgi:hypothetical protein